MAAGSLNLACQPSIRSLIYLRSISYISVFDKEIQFLPYKNMVAIPLLCICSASNMASVSKFSVSRASTLRTYGRSHGTEGLGARASRRKNQYGWKASHQQAFVEHPRRG